MEQNPGSGRRTSYDAKYNKIVENLGAEGATDKILYTILGISKATLHRWKHQYPDFAEAIWRGKDSYDGDQIESAVVKKAKGYQFDEVTQEVTSVYKDGRVVETRMMPTKIVTKEVPPDPAAQKLWLTNRRQGRFPNDNKLQISGSKTDPLPKVEIEVTHVETKSKMEGIVHGEKNKDKPERHTRSRL